MVEATTGKRCGLRRWRSCTHGEKRLQTVINGYKWLYEVTNSGVMTRGRPGVIHVLTARTLSFTVPS